MSEMDLKKSYGLHLKVGFLSAVALLIAGFLGFPSYSPSFSVPAVDTPRDTLIIIDPLLPHQPIPPPLPRPAIPEEAETPGEVEIPTIPTDRRLFEEPGKRIASPPAPDSFIIHDTPPTPIRIVKPPYPDIARMAEVEGTVWHKLLIDTDGEVKDVMVMDALNPACDSAAVRAARQCLFSPALRHNKPVAVWAAFWVDFRLRD